MPCWGQQIIWPPEAAREWSYLFCVQVKIFRGNINRGITKSLKLVGGILVQLELLRMHPCRLKTGFKSSGPSLSRAAAISELALRFQGSPQTVMNLTRFWNGVQGSDDAWLIADQLYTHSPSAKLLNPAVAKL